MSTHRIITADYHRNGVGGAGFYVAIVETTDSSDRSGDGRYLCIDFTGEGDDCDPGRFAVLRMDKLTAGNIAMHPLVDPDHDVRIENTGGNAWRGADRWGVALRPMIRDWVTRSFEADRRVWARESAEREVAND